MKKVGQLTNPVNLAVADLMHAIRQRRVAKAVEHRTKRFYLSRTVQLHPRADIVRLGTDDGEWLVPSDLLAANSVCYCAGVGEDATFDLALIEQFGCDVYAFDPTPRAISYAQPITTSEPKFHFYPFGLWSKDTTIRFYAPQKPQHVSHSALNLRKTTSFFEAPVRSLPSIMNELGHDRIDMLKMDIEGAEHEVLEHMHSENIRPAVLCLEFDQPYPLRPIRSRIKQLELAGYSLVSVEQWNFTFVYDRPKSA